MTRAIILAGGYGTRMGPLTQRRPKHLLPLGDEPVIAHQLRWLAAAGITDIVLATAYQADAFRPALGDGAPYGVQLRYVREETPLGTAGALRHAFDGLEVFAQTEGASAQGVHAGSAEAVVVLNGDLVTEHDIRAQLEVHARTGAMITLHVRHVDDARPFGLVELSAAPEATANAARIARFSEKPTQLQAGHINAGTYVVSVEALREVPPGVSSSLERQVFPDVAARGEMWAYLEDARFADIGTPQSLLAANLWWAAARGRTSVNLSNRIDATAEVHESLIMPNAVVGPGAAVTGSIVAPGAVIGAGAHLTDCVVADDARVGSGITLEGRTLEVDESH